MLTKLKAQILREAGDHGADTLGRYYAQMVYTAYWCIRMLRKDEEIEAVIPEGTEDLVILRRGVSELHQVKTRQESVGAWTCSEVLPILCKQYYRRNVFPNQQFHFVSNSIADTRAQRNYIPLYRLKFLLEIKHSKQVFKPEEQEELEKFEKILVPYIQSFIKEKHDDDIDVATATSWIYNTWIDTECSMLYTQGNEVALESALTTELSVALEELFPGLPQYSLRQLNLMYEKLLLLVLKKIVATSELEERYIYLDDVLKCRSVEFEGTVDGYPDLSSLPGKTILDKKALLGGFHPTEIPRFHRQKVLAEGFKRKYQILGVEDNLENLASTLLELHAECRDQICRLDGNSSRPGPKILSLYKSLLPDLVSQAVDKFPEIDALVCLGLLWSETDNCFAWWSDLKDLA
ncbi:hypothetical protein KSC_046210 [Ktedonobacter sp. SOSP1-52]|uniref:dsDNA nuclease domain-containing protein n=1 Tax=Ktedonobacter sp. SOSP1-52 TaxID=2778366 RepID=UPI001915C9DF|nr:dsDNA nuclease domain-containing protein [Ktedonobacter sp. SOSP1-52]GHO65729.1 hypothetical protein KSC_046210 [Ktedonobacter sp. SOSP1-52]